MSGCREEETALKVLSVIEVDNIMSVFAQAIPSILNTIQLTLNNNYEDALLNLLEDLDECVT